MDNRLSGRQCLRLVVVPYAVVTANSQWLFIAYSLVIWKSSTDGLMCDENLDVGYPGYVMNCRELDVHTAKNRQPVLEMGW